MLKKCLVEIWKCEPQSLLMAFGLALMEALIPLGSALLSVFLINGLEAGADYESLLVRTVAGVGVLFVLNAVRGGLTAAGCRIRNTAMIWSSGNLTIKIWIWTMRSLTAQRRLRSGQRCRMIMTGDAGHIL